MKRITFYVCVNDVIKLFDSCNLVKIVFTADGDFKIMNASIEYKPTSPGYCVYLSFDNYKKCNQNAKKFTKWLNSNKIGTGTINIYEQNEAIPQCAITTVWR